MATWKKLVVSGSDISQLNNDALYLTAADLAAFSTASFNGTDLIAADIYAALTFASASGDGLNIEANAGSNTLTWSLVDIPNASLLNDSITFGADVVALGDTVNQLNISGYTGSFTGSLSAGSVLEDGVSATTQAQGNSSTLVATTEYVDTAVGASSTLVISGSDDNPIEILLASEDLELNSANLSVDIIGTDNALDFSVNTSSAHFEDGVRGKISVADTTGPAGIDMSYDSSTGIISGSLVNSSITIGNEEVFLGDSVTTLTGLTISESIFSGSFSGSFQGDGSGLTGLVSTLAIDGDVGGPSDVDLQTQTLDIAGDSNITTTVSGQTITVSLNDDVVIAGDLTVIGTASFQETTNTTVADRFILLASGSNAAGSGGFVVQQGTQGVGEVFGFDVDSSRWAVSSSMDASNGDFNSEAFMAAVLTGNADSDATIDALVPDRYEAKGNIFIGDDEGIWIWS